MNRPLRLRHRRLVTVLGVLLPVAFGIGIAARKPVLSAAKLPAELAASSGNFIPTDGELWNLFRRSSIRVRQLYQPHTPRRAVRLFAPQNFAKPDLLVYWVPVSPTVTDKLPENATLLGVFNSLALELPTEAAHADGSLILFSLADQEIVDVSKPARFVDAIK